MDQLNELISTLSESDKREFRIFINRQKNKVTRKDLDLFELIVADKPKEEIVKELYLSPNKVAYHTLRKRLLKHLINFVIIKQVDEDNTTNSSVLGLISLATYLFNKKSTEMAWRVLRKAEKLAIENELHDLLHTIYHLQIDKSDSEFSPDINEIHTKLLTNKAILDENEKANIAYNFIKNELNKLKIKGTQQNLETIIDEFLKKYDVETLLYKRPNILFKVLDLTRRILFAKKDFYAFEPYLIRTYNLINNRYGFSKNNHFYKINLLYLIAHILFRNRKFEESNNYLEEMFKNMNAYNGIYFNYFFSKYIQLKASSLSYLDKNTEAIDLLNNIENQMLAKMSVQDQLNIQLNLSVYYFNENDFKKASFIHINFNHSESWYEKKMGKEWVLKKDLIDIIIQYELGNVEIVLNRIRAFEASFTEFLQQPIYQRALGFLFFIKTLIDTPELVKDKDYQQKLANQLINIPQEQEDLQAMAFYCWMKSKMINKPYYSVLLDVVCELKIYPPLKKNKVGSIN